MPPKQPAGVPGEPVCAEPLFSRPRRCRGRPGSGPGARCRIRPG
ncbi:hypothetical protein [Lysobacter gummosus]